jgi:molybdopterin-guanine dinucleotide biosynthesis protein A
VVPRTPAGYEPVFALYHKNCLPAMKDLLQAGNYRIIDLYQQIAIRYLAPPALPAGWQRALLNVNTPQQLEALKTEAFPGEVIADEG